MLDLIVEHQAGIPVLMKPLSGNTRDTTDFAQVVRQHSEQLHTPYGTTYLVADRALYSAEHLQTLSATRTTWITRVPATISEAHEALTQADPQRMQELLEGYRSQVLTSTYGGVPQRWLLIDAEHRHPQAQRTVAKQWLKHSAQAVNAWHKLCRTTFAWQAAAQQALTTFERSLRATSLPQVSLSSTPRYGKRGRPAQATPPKELGSHLEGALASSIVAHQALVAQHSCFILATNELDEAQLSSREVLDGYKGQAQAERGFRFLKDPRFLASSLYLKKPERIMALLMVMTVCLLVYAALEYRIRAALKANGATFPDQKGKRIQHPTARWVFHYFVGIQVLYIPDQRPIVINLSEEHQHLLQFLGDRYAGFYR
jgi:transposase